MAVELATDFSRGSIYFVDPLTPFVQNPAFDFFNTISVIPISSQEKAKDKIGAVHLPPGKPSGLTKDSWVLVWQIRTINKNLFFKENYRDKISEENLQEIQVKLKEHLLL